MDKKKTKKLIIAIFLFILGSLSSIYLASYIHIFLTKGLDGMELFDLPKSIKIIASDNKALKLFLILELGNVLFCFLYFIIKDRFYESDLMEITPGIKIPIPAGQGQFGSARFMTEEEAKNLFTVNEINRRDELIQDLIKEGKKDIKNIKEIIKTSSKEGDSVKKEDRVEKEVKTKEDVETEGGVKVEFKYKLQEEIYTYFQNDSVSLNYYMKAIEEIDKYIELEKNKTYEKLNQKLELIMKSDEKEKLKAMLEKEKNYRSNIIEEEIGKIKDEGLREELNLKLTQLYSKLNKIIKNHIKKIESLLSSLELTEESDLDEHMKIILEIKNIIETMPISDDQKVIRNKVLERMRLIVEENDRRLIEITKNIN